MAAGERVLITLTRYLPIITTGLSLLLLALREGGILAFSMAFLYISQQGFERIYQATSHCSDLVRPISGRLSGGTHRGRVPAARTPFQRVASQSGKVRSRSCVDSDLSNSHIFSSPSVDC